MIKRLVLVRQDRQRAVISHRPNGLFSRCSHGSHQKLEIFLAVAKRLLQIEQRCGRPEVRRRTGDIGRGSICRRTGRPATIDIGTGVADALELDANLLDPLAIRFAGRQLILQFLVINNAALLEVDQKHLARLQTPLANDAALGHRQDTRLGGHNHHPVIGDAVARRAQAVSIQRCADLAPIREGERGGPIPRLHHGRMELIERTPPGIHQRMVLPGLGNHHHDGLSNRVARHHQQLETVIERSGIALACVNDRVELAQIVTQNGRLHHALARAQPVVVALDRIDFAVVGNQPVGVGERPLRECVGRKPLMDQRQGRNDPRVAQVEVVPANLITKQEPLVDDRACTHGGHEILAAMGKIERLNGVTRHLADDIELALKRVGHHHVGAAADEHLTDHGFFGAHRGRHRHGVIERHIAPAQQDLSGRTDRALEFLFTGQP